MKKRHQIGLLKKLRNQFSYPRSIGHNLNSTFLLFHLNIPNISFFTFFGHCLPPEDFTGWLAFSSNLLKFFFSYRPLIFLEAKLGGSPSSFLIVCFETL